MLKARRVLAIFSVVVGAVGVLGNAGCGRTRTNNYLVEVTAPTESERVRVQLDGREIAAFAGFESKTPVSRNETTPFPLAKPPLALKGEIFGPDGWIAAETTIDSRAPEWIERELATGVVLPIRIYIRRPDVNPPLYVYVDNRGQGQASRIALGQAERTVAAGEASALRFLSPTSDAGTVLRVDGVEIGRMHRQTATQFDQMEQISWLVDVSGKHRYRQRAVFYLDRRFINMVPPKKDEIVILKSARLYSFPTVEINYFLEAAPSSISGIDLDLSKLRIELLDAK